MLNLICAVLWGICAVLNFMAGNTFLGVLDVILVLMNGMLAGMNSDRW